LGRGESECSQSEVFLATVQHNTLSDIGHVLTHDYAFCLQEDDEDMEFPQALDFGDGTTYTLPVPTNNRDSEPVPATQNEMPGEAEVQQSDKPVFKHERFAKDDFDRSWPPKAQYSILPQDKARTGDQDPHYDHTASTRTLYNARSNKMEPSFDRPLHSSAEVAPTQILPRSGKEGVPQPGANAHMHDKQTDLQPLARQTSRDRPWGRVQPPMIASERNPWARRRPSETDHSRTWGPPQGVSDHQAWPRGNDIMKSRQVEDESRSPGGKIRSPADLQSQLPPLFSQSHATSVAAPVAVAPSELDAQPIDITELQKDEMHRAAEQARLRRQQEEAEREAQKERARQKAKELAEREMLKETSRLPPSAGLELAAAQPLLQQKDDTVHLPKVIVKRTEPIVERPQNPIARPTPSLLSTQRRSSDKRVAFEDPISRNTQRSPDQAQYSLNSGSRSSQQTVSTAYTMQRDSKIAQSSNLSSVSEHSRAFSAFFDPLAESAHVETPAVIHFDDLPSLSIHGKDTMPSDMAKLAVGANARFSLRPELLQAESWRKSTRGQEVVVPGVIGSSRESGASSSVLVSKPAVQTIPDTLQTSEDLPHSPRTEVKVTLPKPDRLCIPGSVTDPSSANANVGSAFDTVLARLQNAMALSNDGGYLQADLGSGSETGDKQQATPPIPLEEIENIPQRPHFLVLPRPNDFVFSMLALPPSPGPAWKRYTIRLPRSTNSHKSLNLSSSINRMHNEVPRGWALSWDPPLELGSRNLSRDDWLMPKTYHRGKPATIVKPPSKKFQPYVPPQEDLRPSESSSITSQTLKEDGHRLGARKIIVKLPTGKARSSTVPSEETGMAENEFVREEFQTSSEIPLLSPVSSSEHLPSSAQNTAAIVENNPALQGKLNRKVPEGVAIAFARPHSESFSEDADAKSSVRFMVSSEIEDDNLLSEVNKMSMDGLTENPAAEDLHIRARETESRVSCF
jgi:serine/arginine repetitive matrix protein 2